MKYHRLLSSLIIAMLLSSCASKNDPEYTRRVKEYGKPDLISEQSAMGPRYYSPDLASQRPPRTSEVYYYLDKDKEVHFRKGMEPTVTEIPPTMKDSITNLSREVKQ